MSKKSGSTVRSSVPGPDKVTSDAVATDAAWILNDAPATLGVILGNVDIPQEHRNAVSVLIAKARSVAASALSQADGKEE